MYFQESFGSRTRTQSRVVHRCADSALLRSGSYHLFCAMVYFWTCTEVCFPQVADKAAVFPFSFSFLSVGTHKERCSERISYAYCGRYQSNQCFLNIFTQPRLRLGREWLLSPASTSLSLSPSLYMTLRKLTYFLSLTMTGRLKFMSTCPSDYNYSPSSWRTPIKTPR